MNVLGVFLMDIDTAKRLMWDLMHDQVLENFRGYHVTDFRGTIGGFRVKAIGSMRDVIGDFLTRVFELYLGLVAVGHISPVEDTEDALSLVHGFFTRRCIPILTRKGRDYSVDEDTLLAFKEIEASLATRGVDQFDVLYIFLCKQWRALSFWFSERNLHSETVEERIIDIVNYCLMGYCLLVEYGHVDSVNARGASGSGI